jgi:hypothetical protein
MHLDPDGISLDRLTHILDLLFAHFWKERQ